LQSLGTTTTANAQAVNMQDSLALVDLYNSTNGSAWINHTNWLTGPVSSWYGISVTGSRVITINFITNNMNVRKKCKRYQLRF